MGCHDVYIYDITLTPKVQGACWKTVRRLQEPENQEVSSEAVSLRNVREAEDLNNDNTNRHATMEGGNVTGFHPDT